VILSIESRRLPEEVEGDDVGKTHMTIRAAVLACLVVGCFVLTSATQTAASPAGQTVGQVASATLPAGVSKTADVSSNDYVIGPDDVLSIVFWRDQQLSGDVLVRPDGKISVPLLDDILAAGLTPRQLRDRLVVEARNFVSEPVVATVVVKQINSRKVYITGQVVRPGQYTLTPSMNVLQLIATAGGLGDYAKPKSIRIVRVQLGQATNLRFDYEEAIKQSKTARNVELKAGDTVVVP
jgi:polysaccharide export outer membrane protein